MTSFAAAMAERESRAVRTVRRASIIVACLFAVSFTWSIIRRVKQVMRIELRVSSPVLAPGTKVGYDIVTSGAVQNRLVLELVQGTRSEILFEQRGEHNRVSDLDPRIFHYTPSITITPALLARFEAGPATLRVTGFGGTKLLHTPAPRVRSLEVRLNP